MQEGPFVCQEYVPAGPKVMLCLNSLPCDREHASEEQVETYWRVMRETIDKLEAEYQRLINSERGDKL